MQFVSYCCEGKVTVKCPLYSTEAMEIFRNPAPPHPPISITQGRIYARAKGVRAQGGILKKIEIEVWYAGGKRLSTREKFKGDLY
jgi:hypothetical protein